MGHNGYRGKEGLTAFSSGKFDVRSADIARLYKERADIDIDDLDNDLFIDMEALAEAYWFLSQQPKTCWTHELDIRTYREKW